MRKSILILSAVAVLLMASCATVPQYERTESYLTRAVKPVTVVSTSDPGGAYVSVTFVDARGKVFTVDSRSLWSLKPGDVVY